jgi:hypothetical protein
MDMPAATDIAPPGPLSGPRIPPPIAVPGANLARPDDVTVLARPKLKQELSVHDELTVIGQIPREALDYERAFAQRTQPPPPRANDEPVESVPAARAAPVEPEGSPPPRFSAASPEVPSAEDTTRRASPLALAGLEPPTGPLDTAPLLPSAAPRRWHRIRIALMLLALVLVSFLILKRR